MQSGNGDDRLLGDLRRVSRGVTSLAVILLAVGLVLSLWQTGHAWSREQLLLFDPQLVSHRVLRFAVAVMAMVPTARVYTAAVRYGADKKFVDTLVALIVLAELLLPLLVPHVS